MKTRGRKQNAQQTRRRYRSRILKNMRGGTAVENPKTGTVAVCGEDESTCWFVVPHKFANSVGLDENTQLVWNAFTNFFREGGISAEDLSLSIHSTCGTEPSSSSSSSSISASNYGDDNTSISSNQSEEIPSTIYNKPEQLVDFPEPESSTGAPVPQTEDLLQGGRKYLKY